MAENITRPNNVIYYDDAHIEAEAATLPKVLREPYVWLKTYLRDNCGRDVDVLVQKFRDVGVTIDKTNWVRIAKGRWRINPQGYECTPCVSSENLLTSIRALQELKRVELLQGRVPFVETSMFHMIRRFVEKKMRRERVNRFGVIVGPTGTQKTASYKELARRDRFIKWLEAPDNGSIKEFALRLAVKCGSSNNTSYFSARQKIYQNIGTEHCIIVDNTQSMVRSQREIIHMGKPVDEQPAYQFMRSLQDETGCAFIWSITPENVEQMFDAKSIYYEQFEGRAGGRDGFLQLPNYSPKKDIVQIAEAMGLKDAEKYADALDEIARQRGRIRRFFELIQEAKFAADADGKAFTWSYVEEELEDRGVQLSK